MDDFENKNVVLDDFNSPTPAKLEIGGNYSNNICKGQNKYFSSTDSTKLGLLLFLVLPLPATGLILLKYFTTQFLMEV